MNTLETLINQGVKLGLTHNLWEWVLTASPWQDNVAYIQYCRGYPQEILNYFLIRGIPGGYIHLNMVSYELQFKSAELMNAALGHLDQIQSKEGTKLWVRR